MASANRQVQMEKLRLGYSDILEQYLDYGEGLNLNFLSPVYYALHGHFYTGTYASDPQCADFLKLINRLALINPAYLQKIADRHLFETQPFGYVQQKALIEILYALFSDVEQDYFEDLQAIDRSYINSLSQ